MKRTTLKILMGGLLLLCSGSSFAQTADFTFAYTNGGCAPDSVLFTNTSTGAHAYRWDFGDFSPPDTNANPYHIYLFDGTFVVELTAYDTLSGDSNITTQLLLINFTPFPGWAGFFANPNPVCPNDETQFGNFLFPPPAYTIWDFDDGDSSFAMQPTHTFSGTGDYMVTFIAGNVCGSDTFVDRVTVDTNAPIFASWWANPNPACPGQSITFNDSIFPAPVSQIWDFGDGDSATTFNAFHTYPDTGTYMVTLIAFSSCNSDTLTAPVVVDSSLVPFVNIFGSPTRVCPGDDVDFEAFGSNLLSYLWDFGDSSVSLQQNPTHSFTDTGEYTVIFVGTNYCGNSDTDTMIVTVGDSIPPSFIGFSTNPFSTCSSFSSICPGSSVQFTNTTEGSADFHWDFDDGDTSILVSPSHAFPDTGTYNVTLTATTSCNGTDSVTNCVYVVNNANPDAFFCTNPFCFPFAGAICLGTPVIFVNWSSDTSMSFWDFGDGETSNLAEPIHIYTDTGTYVVLLTVTNDCGLTDYHAETIVVSSSAAPPDHDIEVFPGIACPGEIMNFNLSIPPFFAPVDTADLLWDFGDGNTSTVTNPNYAYSSSGSFTVTVIVFTACGNDTTTTSVTVKPGSSPDFSYTSVCLGDSVQFTDASTGSPESYAWDFGDGDTSTVQNPLHEFDSSGVTYMVSLTVVDSGCVSSITKPVTVGATTLIMSSIDANCGQADGQASAAPSGGTPPYTYIWDDIGGQTNATATGLSAGTYQVVAEDAIGCVDSGNVVVGNVAGGVALIAESNNATCFGVCDGDATVTIAGGTAPYTYGWDDPATQTTITAVGLCAGSFDVIVTDAIGCEDTATVIITQPVALVASISGITNALCNGDCNGTATATQVGGTGPYTYIWDDPGAQTTAMAIGLCAGAINVAIIDNNGCTSNSGTVITQPLVLALAMDSIDASCGNANGSAIVAVSGGTSPYTYLWDDLGAQTTDTASGIIAGTYEVAVEDNNGCADTANVVVNGMAGPSASISGITSVSCFGGNDGDATGSGSGGTSPYTYLWDDPGTQTNATATGLVAGSYEVFITDNIGCEDSADVVITQPAELTATTDSVDASCFGVCDGEAIVTPAGGTLPYTYAWDDPFLQVTDTAIALCPGTYNATVTDNNGCQGMVSVNIDQPALLTSPITASNDVSCNGFCDGDATTTPAGGILPYTYLWGNAQTTSTATTLCMGVYGLTVTDNNGCTSTNNVLINGPTTLVVSIASSNNASCNTVCDGNATGSVSGGTGPYTYLWDDPGAQTNLIATGLCAGSFDFAAEDANGCSDTATIVITEPTALVTSISGSNNATCNGVCDGDATGSAAGGTGPFTYLWDDPGAQNTTTATGLCAGTYDFAVTDANACTDTATIVITDPTALVASISAFNDASCNGFCDGDATASGTGGTGSYTYLWDDPIAQTNALATALCAGTFSCIITDANGCVDTIAQIIGEPTAIMLTMGSVDATCGVSNGEASVSAAGGTAPYTYLWDDPGAQTTDTATALGAGGYSVDVTDATGCIETGVATVNNTGAATVTISASTNVSCFGGSDGDATVTAVGGTPPYTYSWDDPGAQTGATATGLVAGTYVAIVTDNVGCIGTDVVVVTEPTALVASMVSNNATCFAACDGDATVSPSGGTSPYTYVWTDPSAHTTAMATGLCAGSYDVAVTDANGCIDSSSVVITEPAQLTATISGSTNVTCNGACDGTATASVSGGVTPYTYLWNDGSFQTTATAISLCAGIYSVTVSDVSGCTQSANIILTQPQLLTLSMTTTSSTCGFSNGGACVNVIGGSSPYVITWNDPNTTVGACLFNVFAGTYNPVVSDANGCTFTMPVVISDIVGPTVDSIIATDVICAFDSNGTATVFASVVAPPLTYIWKDNSGATIDSNVTTIFGLWGGTYSVTVIDANGCIDSAMVVITEPSAVVATITDSSDASCNAECDGTVTVSASGGGGPYGYSWDDLLSQNTTIADSLCAGPYSVIVTDTSGCTDTASVVIAEPSVITLVMGSTDATCGVANGTATVSASGGAGSYAYLWDDPGAQTTDTATALNAGGYTVMVTDTSGCSESGVVSVNNTGAAAVSIASITNVSCNGANDGSAVVLATGGTPPYTYSWDDPGTQSTDTATGLAGGTYVATVTDSVGCIASDIAVVLEPAALSLSTGTSDASCAGVCDGTAMVTATGGTGTYTYLWDDPKGQSTATADSLCAGGYNVMVTDSNGCQISDSATVVEPTILTVSSTSSSPSCPGLCDATATAVVGGGTPTYTYLWTDSIGDTLALGGSIGGLCAGNYGLTVTDGNGCPGAAAFTLSYPANMVLSFTSATASCGAANGSASVTVTNGTPPYTYLWDDPGAQTTDTASALAAGTYSVTVTDSSGCTASANTTVGNTGAPNVSISVSSASCNGLCDGSATATATGGTDPLTYLWNDPAATTDLAATGLCAGTYTIMVTDSNGCVAFASDTIVEPSAMALSGSSTDATCNGDCDGSATVTASGGASPYTHLWDDPSAQTTAMANALCAGTYIVVVSDASGCMDSLSTTITDPPAVSVSTVSVDVSGCGLCDGSVAATASGGTGTLAYLWDDPGTQTTATASSLCSGVYSVMVTDSNGCIVSTADTVSSPGGLFASISGSSDASCNGVCDGTATAAATGGTAPYTYLWDDPGAQTTAAAVGLCAGTFSCIVTDTAGCTSTVNVTLTEPGTAVTASGTSTDASCAGICDGTATVTASGGTPPYTYLWDDPGTQTDSTATGLCGGAISAIVTDGNGCTVTVNDSILEGVGLTTNFTSTDATSGLSDGTATVTASGGTLPYTYLWDDASVQTTSTATGLPAGTYTCTVTDSSGCTSSGSATVGTQIGLQELAANLSVDVYPNPAIGKVTLLIESAVPSDISIRVQNLIGEVLLETSYTDRSSVNEQLNLGELPNGVYLIRAVTESGSVNRRIVVAR